MKRIRARCAPPDRGREQRVSTLLPCSALRACGLVESSAQPAGKLQRVVIGPEMHEEQPRLLVEHVAVERRHLDAVRAQGLNNGIHFLPGQHEIAGDRGLAGTGRLKAYGGRDAKWAYRSELRTVFSHGVPARHG